MSTVADFHLSPPEAGRVDLLVIAGEHSGDQHAATLLRELRAKDPDLSVCALGGDALAAAGAQLLYDLTASSVVGLVEVLKNYRFFKTLFTELVRWIGRHQPRAVLFVDYPGMNLRLARALRERSLSRKGGGSIKLLYYISPQIWAWKKGRRFSMARDLDALAVIFPFEPACYADTDLLVEFVGHPFVAKTYEAPVRYDPSAPILLLPGSRKQAVARIFPALLAGCAAYGKREALVLYPSEAIREVLENCNPPGGIRLVSHNDAPLSASAVLMSSGTMSLHVALAGIPGAIAYQANPLTYVLGRLLVKIPFLGISNLLLKPPMYPEFLQGAASAKALAAELADSIENPQRVRRTQAQAVQLRELLQGPSSGSAADWVQKQLELERVSEGGS